MKEIEISDKKSGFLNSPYPQKPGVYLMYDLNNKIIYIGKAKNLRKRIKSYFIRRSKDEGHQYWKTNMLISKVKNIDYIITDNEIEAFLLESNLIKKYRPVFNIELKDQQRYTYLRITNEKFPRLNVARRNRNGDLSNDTGEIVGPFVKGSSRYLTVGLLRKMFKIRICNKLPKKECLEYHMGNCDAPCINKISFEKYKDNIDSLRNILKNNDSLNDFCQKLELEMKESSRNKEYERAIYFRDTIHRLQNLLENQKIENSIFDKAIEDYIGFYEDKVEGIVHVMTLQSRNGVINDMKKYQFDLLGDNSITTFISQYYLSSPVVPNIIYVNETIENMSKIEEILFNLTQTRVKIVTLDITNTNNDAKQVSEKQTNLKIMRLILNNLNAHIKKGYEPALDDLVHILGLKRLPYIIDCFDISNLGNDIAVGACTRFVNGRPAKSEYMKFRIKNVNLQNDFLMMDEVIRRRYNQTVENKVDTNLMKKRRPPDLILIDGGKGHLQVALKSLRAMGLEGTDCISLAKENEEIYTESAIDPIIIPRSQKAIKILQHIRDESHRFGLNYNRSLRKQKFKLEFDR